MPTALSSQAFAEWWAIYPKKVCKADARKKFAKVIRTADNYKRLCDNTQAWAAYWDGSELQYVPYPATFLNRGQWEDAPPANGKARPKDPCTCTWEAANADCPVHREQLRRMS